jgi:hypothetical protein
LQALMPISMSMQRASATPDRVGDEGRAHRRLAVASRLAARLTRLESPATIAEAVVEDLHSAFGYYLAVVQRLDLDRTLRVVAGAGPLAHQDANFLAWEQPITVGVNGRVARNGRPELIQDTTCCLPRLSSLR